ncbi:MAG: T9SS C-terminal target domain-containing protein [Bacteroidetes bacterium]|nr:T9SS C-terminal target domain-containing protein [Bacteroidota bacterium]
MKQFVASLAILVSSTTLFAQPKFNVELKELSIDGLQGTHSFVAAQDGDGNILVIGGRTDGLHKRRPFEAFLESDNNTNLVVFNPRTKKQYVADLSELSTVLYEQLQSTNMQFEQVGDLLYITGGYGYSTTAKDHITYPNLVVVEYKKVINAIINEESFNDYFSQVSDTRFQVTGGHLHFLNDTFYLVGGQKFMGRYNPMGPDHGPGFVQEYTNEIRKFTLKSNYSIDHYNAIRDTANLHRRDYNVVKQIFANGEVGLTAFTGVFQYAADVPWLNVVNITSGGYNVVSGFEQKLSQYHSANLPVFDSTNNEMHTFFFGGMAQFTYRNNVLTEDTDVPFVKTISVVSRNSKGQLSEYKVGEMPGYLGAGAEFFAIEKWFTNQGILKLDALNNQKTLVGYIYGGIESDEENIFFTNTVDQTSRATNKIFEVYVDFSTSSIEPVEVHQTLDFEFTYGRGDRNLKVELLEDLKSDSWNLTIVNMAGNVLTTQTDLRRTQTKVSISYLPYGIYWLVAEANGKRMSKPFRVY